MKIQMSRYRFDAEYIQLCEQKDTCRGILLAPALCWNTTPGQPGPGAGSIPSIHDKPLSQGTESTFIYTNLQRWQAKYCVTMQWPICNTLCESNWAGCPGQNMLFLLRPRCVTAAALCWECGQRSLEFPSSGVGAHVGGGMQTISILHHRSHWSSPGWPQPSPASSGTPSL